jgi:hypothetical protein
VPQKGRWSTSGDGGELDEADNREEEDGQWRVQSTHNWLRNNGTQWGLITMSSVACLH